MHPSMILAIFGEESISSSNNLSHLEHRSMFLRDASSDPHTQCWVEFLEKHF